MSTNTRAIQAGMLILTCAFGTLGTSVLAQVCAIPGRDGSTFSDNTYYPGASTSGAGTSNPARVSIGNARNLGVNNAKALSVGDLVLVIQVQNAEINTSNTANYGAGSGTGRGYIDLRNAGKYEFARVTALGSGTVTLDRALTNTYTAAGATATDGQRSFQVIRVPQFSSLTLSSTVTVTPWNGQTGGVFVLNVAGRLDLSGTIDASSAGFRGGGSREGRYVSGFDRQWGIYHAAPWGSGTNNAAAYKGEGIAGTPSYVRGTANTAFSGVALTSNFGYPTGTVNLNPSGTALNVSGNLDTGAGAAANAGGGGSQHNAGGGGGSNAGFGGRGGNSFAFYRNPASGTCVNYGGTFNACDGDGSRAVGGYGGVAISPSASYLLMGGGGGAGETNNASDNASIAQGSGGNGGGVIFLIASTITGSGTLLANGQNGQPGGRDAAGGGGAGGTIAIATNTSPVPLNVQVMGGGGGNTGSPLYSNETQGPAGGGGGGAVLLPTGTSLSSAPVLNGGVGGVNRPNTSVSNPYGTSAGDGGVGNIIYNNAQIPSSPACLPRLSLSKKALLPGDPSSATNPAGLLLDTPGATRQPEYLITVTNTGLGGASGVTVADSLPAPFTYAGPTGTTLSTGALRPTSTDPSSGASALSWSSFVLPGGESVTLRFPVNRGQAVGTFQNPASVVFVDPTDSSGTRLVSPLTAAPGGANTAYTLGGPVLGSNYAAGSSTQEDIIIGSDLRVSKQAVQTGTGTVAGSGTPQTVRQPGQGMDYLVTVANLKAVDASNITVLDTLPSSLTAGTPVFTASPNAPSTGSVTFSGNTLSIPNLAAGQRLTMRLPVTVNIGVGTGAITILNTATLSGSTPADTGTNGSSSANNTETSTVSINPVQLVKTVRNVTQGTAVGSTVSAVPQDTLEYCITASSLLTTASSASVTDLLLPNQTFVANSITGVGDGAFASGTVSGTLIGVSSSTPQTMCFRTTVN